MSDSETEEGHLSISAGQVFKENDEEEESNLGRKKKGAESTRSHNTEWRVKNQLVRPSMFSSDVQKIGVLKKMNSVKLSKRFTFERATSYYFELSGTYLRYYKIHRKFGERFRKRLTFFGKSGKDVQSRIHHRERPLAAIDVRLVTFELDPRAEDNHMFRVVSSVNEEFLELKATSFLEARSWVRVLERCKEQAQAEEKRRSEQVSFGLLPRPQSKQEMEKVATTPPDVENVFIYAREEARMVVKEVLENDPSRNGFAIVSFNILADMFVSKARDPSIYRHCDKGCLTWDYRSKRIIRHLRRTNADIICLQEVEKWFFEGELGTALGQKGYMGVIDCNEKKTDDGIVLLPGTATFYKKNLFKVVWQERSFRSLVIGLEILRGREKGNILASVNSHLEGAPWRVKDRASQMKSALRKVDLRSKANQVKYTILCGDYNDGALSDLCQQVLGSREFMNAYDNNEARDVTCLLLPLDSKTVDIEKHRVDHIFFDSRLTLRAVMNVMEERWSRTGMIEQGLPSFLWPSDHLSIGAVFSFNPASEKFHKKQDLPMEEEPDPFLTETSETIFADPTLNPLTEEEKQTFIGLDNLEQGNENSKQGKRSPTSIQRLKEQAKKKEEFLTSLSDDKELFLRKYIKLTRQERKKRATDAKKKAMQERTRAKREELKVRQQTTSSTIGEAEQEQRTKKQGEEEEEEEAKAHTTEDVQGEKGGRRHSLIETLRRASIRLSVRRDDSSGQIQQVAMPVDIPHNGQTLEQFEAEGEEEKEDVDVVGKPREDELPRGPGLHDGESDMI